jgi:hypothetical protein
MNCRNAEAWHIVATTDPLMDSDEEHPDEHVHLDYSESHSVVRLPSILKFLP